MTIMTHKDCEEWAAMIAQMQDDPSYHPVYNKKGVRMTKDRGPNDLEEQISRLKFRNDADDDSNTDFRMGRANTGTFVFGDGDGTVCLHIIRNLETMHD